MLFVVLKPSSSMSLTYEGEAFQDGLKFRVQVKVDKDAEKTMRNTNIVKLMVILSGSEALFQKVVVYYDRGWNIIPSERFEGVLKEIIKEVNKMETR